MNSATKIIVRLNDTDNFSVDCHLTGISMKNKNICVLNPIAIPNSSNFFDESILVGNKSCVAMIYFEVGLIFVKHSSIHRPHNTIKITKNWFSISGKVWKLTIKQKYFWTSELHVSVARLLKMKETTVFNFHVGNF